MQLTFDVFSGKANPAWQLPPVVSRRIFDLIGDSGLQQWISTQVFPSRLGYRGLQIVLPPEIVVKYRVSPWLNLPADAFGHVPLFQELAAISQIAGFFGFDEFQRLVRLILQLLQKSSTPPAATPPTPSAGPCAFEMLPFDPAHWNDPAFKPTNNCYAYAANKRALYASKPQPGIGSGTMFSSLTGPDVAAAAKRDGAHDVNDCFPDSEAPRMLVALVIWPGNDYHWYRKHPNCWGHKPGSTDARNVDSSGAVITNPETCDRGPYTEFHGYMLIPKSQKVAA
ncbi:MAG TPA: hypothetical protein VNO18_05485 [Xanthobacteraceae bacterium]|jgi:hypothetical protein|nr:hypothetical protein [Xanthobacteraceae bacterium]